MQVTCTRQLVPDMIKPGSPRAVICRSSESSGIIYCRFNRSTALFPVRKRSTHRQDTHWEITVAMAAPRTPRFKAKINTGSSTAFSTAPRTVVSIPILGNPWALIKPFMPVAIIEKAVPIR